MKVQITLTKAQARAVLAATLSNGNGVRRSVPLIEAEDRIKDAIRQAASEDPR